MTTKTTIIAHSQSIDCSNPTSTTEGMSLDALANKLGLDRHNAEDDEAFSSRCHHRIDALIRQHAERSGAITILELMALHDVIDHLVP